MEGRFIINPIINEYIDSHYKPLNDRMAQFREDAIGNHRPIILKETERFLEVMLRVHRPKRILEFGTSVGYSACFFAEICGEDTEIVTLERHHGTYVEAVENIQKFGYDKQIRVIEGDARETGEELDGIFDFVFIDAGKSHYRKYWDDAVKRCREGSVIVCDNVLMRGSTASNEFDINERKHRTSIRNMRNFLKYITDTDEADTAIMASGDGLAVSIIHKGIEHE